MLAPTRLYFPRLVVVCSDFVDVAADLADVFADSVVANRFRTVCTVFFALSRAFGGFPATIGRLHVRTGGQVYRFGPFELDAGRRRLTRGRDQVWLGDRQLDTLILLVDNAGEIVTKEMLVAEAWHGAAVDDNAVAQTISRLRRDLGRQDDGAPYLTTAVGQGYRFVAPVEQWDQGSGIGDPKAGSGPAILAAHQAFHDGRAALETLHVDAVARARSGFADALSLAPEFTRAHIGLASAGVLAFESTRVDKTPDRDALQHAARHAQTACDLEPSSAHAWGTLAVVQYCAGDACKAIAAASTAVTLEPTDWRHHLRLAWVSWGEERRRASERVLELNPQLALAHWFTATVWVARGIFDKALVSLRAGCAAQDAQSAAVGRYTAVGLHLLHGLVLAAMGAVDEALDECERELARMPAGHVYARECLANTWYAIGALRFLQGQHDGARGAFRQALTHVPDHPLASVGLGACTSSTQPAANANADASIEAAMAHAAALVLNGKHDDAARACREWLAGIAGGSAGWMLPVEPLLQAASHPEAWASTLALLSQRAV